MMITRIMPDIYQTVPPMNRFREGDPCLPVLAVNQAPRQTGLW